MRHFMRVWVIRHLLFLKPLDMSSTTLETYDLSYHYRYSTTENIRKLRLASNSFIIIHHIPRSKGPHLCAYGIEFQLD